MKKLRINIVIIIVSGFLLIGLNLMIVKFYHFIDYDILNVYAAITTPVFISNIVYIVEFSFRKKNNNLIEDVEKLTIIKIVAILFLLLTILAYITAAWMPYQFGLDISAMIKLLFAITTFYGAISSLILKKIYK